MNQQKITRVFLASAPGALNETTVMEGGVYRELLALNASQNDENWLKIPDRTEAWEAFKKTLNLEETPEEREHSDAVTELLSGVLALKAFTELLKEVAETELQQRLETMDMHFQDGNYAGYVVNLVRNTPHGKPNHGYSGRYLCIDQLENNLVLLTIGATGAPNYTSPLNLEISEDSDAKVGDMELGDEEWEFAINQVEELLEDTNMRPDQVLKLRHTHMLLEDCAAV